MTRREVSFEYDRERNILFTVDNYSILTEQDVEDFIRLNLQKLEEIGRKVYLISNIDGLHIGANVSERYGRRSREVFRDFILGFARYGADAATRMTVRTASKKAQLESHIFNTREEAVEAIEQQKGTGAAGPGADSSQG